ncbi:DNA polymerase III subunit beta [filamentous cyanobacterium CCP1]|nr:DNA polymerase III subunit beta [filamentous cyanobacterium CCP2]PSB68061.1 DNA polymerase III subunit beta [filamentous cyanobacterium CCP1]
MKQLPPELLERIVHRLVESLHPEQIILFGSYAYGEPNDDSDIDLLIVVSESDEPSYRRSRKAYAALRGIGVSTDLIVMTREEVQRKADVLSSLASQAVHHGKVIYAQ